jgi:hypothetical protein
VGNAERIDAVGAGSIGRGRLTRAPNVLSRRIVHEVLILRLADEEYFGLAGVGARLWDLLSDGASTDELVATLGDEYEVEAEILRRDVEAILGQLVAADLLTRVPGEPS